MNKIVFEEVVAPFLLEALAGPEVPTCGSCQEKITGENLGAIEGKGYYCNSLGCLLDWVDKRNVEEQEAVFNQLPLTPTEEVLVNVLKKWESAINAQNYESEDVFWDRMTNVQLAVNKAWEHLQERPDDSKE